MFESLNPSEIHLKLKSYENFFAFNLFIGCHGCCSVLKLYKISKRLGN